MKKREIFVEALQKKEKSERAAYLDAACGDDVDLRQEIEEMLEGHEPKSSIWLDDAATAHNATVDLPAVTERVGGSIGPYKLLQQIGEGGFGVVYMAEQERPVRRRVALKIIKLGMNTKQVIARFGAERQVLALMDHPHIAKVLDAGATENGRPYFVMELVKGVPITEYCDRHNVSFRDRLKLFMHVCEAVQHAHQKGIIHRDIKPSNILVAHVDNRPVPKVIDFGIAKATEHRLTEMTMFTEFGQFLGTPAYISPEQADPNALDIDTRSDIYSLGVVLYELLTGTTPFDIKTLRQAGLAEIQRIIRDEEPSKPSTKLSTLGQELTDIAKRRGLEPRKLGTILRGDLDWIILKALDKDRTRRYETSNGFARDVERYLNDEPVVASPPSASYKLRKFIRRNRASVIAAALVGAALIAGMVGTTWGMLWALQEKERADAAAKAEGIAKTEVERKNQQLAVARDRAESRFTLAVSAIDDYRKTIDDNLDVKYRPELEGLRTTLLTAPRDFYVALRDDLAQSDDATPEQQYRLADAYFELAKIDWQIGSEDRAVQSLQAGLKIAEQLESVNPGNVEVQLLVGWIHSHLGNILTAGGERKVHLEHARLRFQQLVDQEADLAEAHYALAAAEYNLGQALANEGQADEAIEKIKASLVSYRAAAAIEPDDHSRRVAIAQVSHTVAQLLLRNRSEPQEALEWLTAVSPEARELAEQYPDNIDAQRAHALLLGMQCEAYQALEQHELALEALGKSQAIWEELARRFPTYTRIRDDQARGLGRTAQLHIRTGRPEQALATLQAQRTLLQQLVDTQPANLMYRASLQRCMMVEGAQYYAMGDKSRSLKCFEQLVPLCKETLQLDSSAVDRWATLAGLYYNMGTIRSEIGDPEMSLADYQRSLEIRERLVAEQPDDPNLQDQLAFTLGNIGTLYLNRLKDPKQAAVWAGRARDVQRSIVAEHAHVGRYVNSLARTLTSLGTIYRHLNAIEQASAAYSEARGALEQLVALNESVTQYRRDLAMACWNQGLVLRLQGNEQAADEAILKAMDTWRTLVEQHPEEQENRVVYHTCQAQHLQYVAETDRIEKALDLADACVPQLEQLRRETPDDTDVQRGLWWALRGRAQTRARAGDLEGAREDYDQAILVLDDETSREDGLLREALLAAWSGDLAAAEAEMQRIVNRSKLTPRQQFLLAKSFSVVATASPDDAGQRQRLADACLMWLQAAAESGYFASAEPKNELLTGPSFAIVRDRDEFTELLRPQE